MESYNNKYFARTNELYLAYSKIRKYVQIYDKVCSLDSFLHIMTSFLQNTHALQLAYTKHKLNAAVPYSYFKMAFPMAQSKQRFLSQ